jgi:hypothetical protein
MLFQLLVLYSYSVEWQGKVVLIHEDVWGSGDIAPPLLTLELDGGEWSILRPGHVILGERGSGNHWIGG